ncbi:MAG: cytidine deaminase [Lachnospiraceae bacterium]|nr:cytidine deaminase [Lachnospiraceae bacterium]
MITDEELVQKAIEAMSFAYAPYSNYYVGAALLTDEDEVYTGCNVENASFSPTNCAERTAVFKAVSEGKRKFKAIAIVGGKKGVMEGMFPPCGVCRQVLREFCDTDLKVLLGKPDGYMETTLGDLLPYSFSPADLK